MLEDSFPSPTSTATTPDLIEYTLQPPVTTQFIKFQVISWFGDRGGLQYFDVVQTTEIERSGH